MLETGNLSWRCPEVHAAILCPAQKKENKKTPLELSHLNDFNLVQILTYIAS